ncbi:hypothetical protein EV182_001699 [Spiromyces aspiralis]|uniref:Uncharacterized protein n=1 Tax=Spiromyces aspiralis TaxID=68401 RepID=A0ACC1HYV9_9FUNG|nr:hypothetical protein EV182_001699 [Spiromyces aspiralis]
MRTARASGKVLMNKTTFDLVKANEVKKGDVLTVAQIAGIQAAKSTADLIPLCHSLLLTHVSLDFSLQDQNIGQDSRPVALSDQDPELTCAINIESSVRCCGETGVEMEALVAASTAALTIYDMCKAVSKNMQITSLRVLEKAGGKSGFWKADD